MGKCRFCDNKLVEIDEIYVCENCKTVAFNNVWTRDSIEISINKYLQSIDAKLSSRSDLHNIKQKESDGKTLTPKEQEIYDLCQEYREIKVNIFLYMKGNLNNENFRKYLYKLFKFSKKDSKLEEKINEQICN